MYSNKQTVVHDSDILQELGISAQLLGQESSLLRSQFENLATVDPVDVFKNSMRVLLRFLLRVLPSDGASFQVISFVDIAMWGEEIVHDDEVDFTSSG